jgi:hypothetical protein
MARDERRKRGRTNNLMYEVRRLIKAGYIFSEKYIIHDERVAGYFTSRKYAKEYLKQKHRDYCNILSRKRGCMVEIITYHIIKIRKNEII